MLQSSTYRWTRLLTVSALVALTASSAISPAEAQSYHGRKVWTLRNNRVNVLIAPGGGHIASVTLRNGPGAGLNPLWLPPWKSVEPGQWVKYGGYYGGRPGAQLLSTILGHNICLDFFGSPSASEIAAGIPAHGEAASRNWSLQGRTRNRISYTTRLPAAQMQVVRTITLAPGSSAFWIKESVTNLSALDRPFGWQQHVTLGPPFLKAGESVYDLSGSWSIVYPKSFSPQQRLKTGAQFQWPNAPGVNGGTVDLRPFPPARPNSDFTVTLVDKNRQWGYFTALNTRRGLLYGYVWPRKDWPWMANWEENRHRTGTPWNGKTIARGIEFGTTPYADTRREMVTMGELNGTPTYRWISARAKQTIGYGGFLTPVPAGTTGVDNVRMSGNSIQISLRGSNKVLNLVVNPS